MLCINCVKNGSLRSVIASNGAIIETCPVCGEQNVTAIESNQIEFKSKFRVLIRYNYSEWHYNTHMGGDGPEALFFTENPITNYNVSWNADAYEEAVLELIDPAYEDYDKGISLFAGYRDRIQNIPLVALKNDFDPRLRKLRKQSLLLNHFLLDEQTKALISPSLSDLEDKLSKGTILFRSRLGFENRATPLMGWGDERHYRPYSGASISAPPPYLVSAGRMNRGGISFLYLATNPDTAIAEIRPYPGHFCSVGSFEAQRELRVANLSAIDVCDYSSSDQRLDEFLLLKSIDDLFSIPVTPERHSEYHFSQLFADAFRHLGFDAVCYRSSVSEEVNYVVFDPQLFNYVTGSGMVFKIAGLRYSSEAMTLMGDDDSYMTNIDGAFF